MDQSTLLLFVVVVVVALSQILQHARAWALKPWVFWPVEAVLGVSLVFVLAAHFPEWPPQVKGAVKAFLALFLVWRMVQNWILRHRGRRDAAYEIKQRELRRRRAAAGLDEDGSG